MVLCCRLVLTGQHFSANTQDRFKKRMFTSFKSKKYTDVFRLEATAVVWGGQRDIWEFWRICRMLTNITPSAGHLPYMSSSCLHLWLGVSHKSCGDVVQNVKKETTGGTREIEKITGKKRWIQFVEKKRPRKFAPRPFQMNNAWSTPYYTWHCNDTLFQVCTVDSIPVFFWVDLWMDRWHLAFSSATN